MEGYNDNSQEVYQQQQQQQFQNPYGMPQMPQQEMSINKDRDFMQWLFNFKEEVVSPLIHIWRGEVEVDPGNWQYPKRDGKEVRSPIMNEKGIGWCSGRISSFINAVYVVSNYDENAMNWTMRKEGRVIWNGLSRQYEEFELKKINIPAVAFETISKIHAVLLGARGDGFRKFFSMTHHIDEVRSTSQQMTAPQQSSGWGLFKRKQPVQQGYGG